MCKFYTNNKHHIVDKAKFHHLLALSFDLLTIKRKKLKTGSTTFVFKQLFYGEWLVKEWFEMEFVSQTSPYELRKKIETTLKMLDWAWDFNTCLILIVFFGVSFNYFSPIIEDYYCIYIAGGFEPTVIRVGLEHVFAMAEPIKIGSCGDIIYNLTSTFVDLALVLELF
jgi:hypothetical protein